MNRWRFILLCGCAVIVIALILSLTLNHTEANPDEYAGVIHTMSHNSRFTDTNYLIACINTQTLEVRSPINKSKDDGGCFLGKGSWMNILTPTSTQWKVIRGIAGNDAAAINRLAIINMESQFDEHAVGKGIVNDCGIAQIHGACTKEEMGLEFQIKTMNDMINDIKTRGCYAHWGNGGEERTLRCVGARYNGNGNPYGSYSNRLMSIRKAYIDYFNN